MDPNDRKAQFFARRMHTPDDPERAASREALREVSRKLLPLHRAMIDAAKEEYGSMFEPVQSPGLLLRLLQEDPFFAWLKPVTALIVDIDEMTATDFTAEDVAAILARLDAMFGATADAAFSERYVALLQRDIDVAAGHAAVRAAISKLRG